ncbi:ribokinase [Microbacterium lacus]|uniref:Ribokinase n=1 Tax=Microbacterium lacus TaxID=415217 RepID=A0ABN2FYS8_9MICO
MTELLTVVGSANIDTVIKVASPPAPGQTVLGRGIERRPGGKGANQAAAAAASGVPTRLVAAFGDDQAGETYRTRLNDRGVNTRDSVIVPGPSGEAIITVDDRGENSIIVIPGANSLLDPDSARFHLGDTPWVLVQLETPRATVQAVITEAHARGAKVALNASPIIPEAHELALQCDLVIVNEIEAAQLEGVQDMCITRGAGAVTWGDEIAMPRPVTVVDTTGAGDAFAGALVAATAAGQSRHRALETALNASAVAVQHEGAQPWRL